MKVEVIARKGFGVTKKGGRVRLPRDHAAALVKMGLAEYPPVVKAIKPEPLSLPKKGQYARRDMVAEPKGTITSPGARYSFSKDDGEA